MFNSFASITDLPRGWRPLSVDEIDRAGWLLGKASRAIRAELPTVDERILSGVLDPDLVADVVCDMVRRQLSTPTEREAVTQASETCGPFARSMTYANPTGEPYLTKAERRRLGIRQQRAASISTEPAIATASPVVSY